MYIWTSEILRIVKCHIFIVFSHVLICFLFYSITTQIIYSKKVAVVLHCVPVLIFVVMPFVLRVPKVGFHIALATLVDFVKGVCDQFLANIPFLNST